MKTQNTNTENTTSVSFVELLEQNGANFSEPTKTVEALTKVNLATLVETISETSVMKLVSLGVHRAISANIAKTAKVGSEAYAVETRKLLEALGKGYGSVAAMERAAKKATETATGTKGKSVAFGRNEILQQARSMTKKTDTATLETLDKIAAYNDEQFSLLLVKVADNPKSLISRAIAELAQRAEEKAKAELAAKLEEIEVV